jgi:hypothetical protein
MEEDKVNNIVHTRREVIHIHIGIEENIHFSFLRRDFHCRYPAWPISVSLFTANPELSEGDGDITSGFYKQFWPKHLEQNFGRKFHKIEKK